MKRVITYILALSCSVATSFAQFTINGITYEINTINNQEVSVCQYTNEISENVEIPSTIENEENSYSVTQIKERAFEECINMRTIKLPNTIKSIGEFAFENCVNLQSIEIPESITTIEEYTFSYCISLNQVLLPNTLKTIGDKAFLSCVLLTEIKLPNSLTDISYSAFNGCQSLKEITIPSEVVNIGKEAFAGCLSLKKVEFLGRTDLTNQSIFSQCDSLETIICRSEKPAICNINAFDNYDIPIYVPTKSIEFYQQESGWENFTNILPLEDITRLNTTFSSNKYIVNIIDQEIEIESTKKSRVEIFNIIGQKKIEDILLQGKNRFPIKSGIWIIKIEDFCKKVVVQ
jgi:hypothetical protein